MNRRASDRTERKARPWQALSVAPDERNGKEQIKMQECIYELMCGFPAEEDQWLQFRTFTARFINHPRAFINHRIRLWKGSAAMQSLLTAFDWSRCRETSLDLRSPEKFSNRGDPLTRRDFERVERTARTKLLVQKMPIEFEKRL